MYSLRLHNLFILVTMLTFLMGCSGGDSNPVMPGQDPAKSTMEEKISESKGLIPYSERIITDPLESGYPNAEGVFNAISTLGEYELHLNEDTKTVDLFSIRNSTIGESYTVSGASYFTVQPCTDCLRIESIELTVDNQILVVFSVTHPWEKGTAAEPPSGKNRLDLDLFDLAIVIVPMNAGFKAYPLMDRSVHHEICTGVDGFTFELKNLTRSPILCPYYLVMDNSETGVEENNRFEMGTKDQRVYTYFKGGGIFRIYLTMGYGASALLITRLNPTYYIPEFNKKAAWKVTATPPNGTNPPTIGNTWDDIDTTTEYKVVVEVHDWQQGAIVADPYPDPEHTEYIYKASNVKSVSVEIPGMTNSLKMVTAPITGTGTALDPLIFEVPIANERHLAAGTYVGLVKVLDERVPPVGGTVGQPDTLVDSPDGVTLRWYDLPEFAAYQIFNATVVPGRGVTVTKPNGGETWTIGSSQTVTWTWGGTITNVNVELSLDGGNTYTVTLGNNILNTGSLMVNPVGDWPTTKGRVRVYDPLDLTTMDQSDANFVIERETAPIEVTSPNGGENWYVDTQKEITWNAIYTINFVRISLSRDGGATYPTVLTGSTQNDGSWTWSNIPREAASNNCKIKINNILDPAVYDESDADFAIIINYAPPPSTVDATDGLYPDKVTVTWSDVPTADSYNVYRDGIQQQANLTVLSWDDTAVTPGVNYDYQVASNNMYGEGPLSIIDVGWACVLPSTPTGVTASDGLYWDRVEVSWNADPEATGYNIFRDDVLVESNWTVGLTWDDTIAVPGVHYNYAVSSVNSCGESDKSPPDEGWKCELPAKVTGVDATDGLYPDRVDLSWNVAARADTYSVFRDDILQQAGLLITSWTDNAPVPGTVYQYTVMGVNTCGDGPLSDPNDGWACVLPGVPTNVDATNGTYTDKVTVTWTAASDATGYNVYRDGIEQVNNWVGLTWDDTTAVQDVVYSYTVSGLNSCGEGTQSLPDDGWCCETAPVPTGVDASDGLFGTKVTVTWNPSAGATGYNIYRDGAIQESNWALVTWDDTSMVPGTHYNYTVTALNFCGESAQSAADEGWACILPDVPTNVSATDGTFPYRVRVTWDTATGATGYNIYRDTVLQETNWPGTSWDDTSITQGVTYQYTVSSLNTCGESAQSPPDSGWACVTAPIPTGVDASDGLYPTKVTVTWNVSAGATGYNIYRDSIIQETNWPGTIWDDMSAVPGTNYDYTVSALNACGESYQSTPDQGWACVLPDPPTNVVASNGLYPDKVEVTWTAEPAATSYNIYRDSVLQQSGWILTTWEDLTIVPGTSYQYSVSSVDACGEGTQSPQDEGWACVIPDAPTNVAATDGTFPYRVRVSWDAVFQATGYNIYRDSVLQESNWTGLTWDDTSVTQGVSYQYTVSAVNACGEGAQSLPDSGWACVTAPIPTGVDASDGLYPTKVTVTWNVSAGATGYNIYRDSVIQEVNWAGTSWDDTSAVPGTNYDYTVSALNACGESYQSTPDQGWACVLPDPPTNVAASDGTYPDKVEVTWTAEPAADSYNIYRDSVLQESGWTLTTWNDTTAVPGTHYQYTVSSVDTCGEGTQSPQNEGWRCVLPAAPTNVAASDGTFPFRVRVTWDAVAGATGYNIYRDSVLQESNWVGLTWDDTSITQGVSYDYTVSAVDACGEGAQSLPDSGWACVTAPIPTGIDASDGLYSNKVTVTWNASAGATGYNIYRDSVLQESNWAATTWDDTTAVPGTNYDYTVSALNACGESYQSTPDTGWACVLPDPPTNVAASDGTYPDKVEVTWTAEPAADSYNIYRDSVLQESGWTLTTWNDTTAVPGTHYQYTVSSVDTCGEGTQSPQNEGWRCVLPAAPTNVAASDGTFPFRVRVTWDAVAGATGYNIYRDSVLQESNWVGLTWDDTSITQGVSYDYTVSTVDTCGEGSQSLPDSGWACVTAPIPTGVDASDGLYSDKVTVTWNASAGATGYNIYRDSVLQESNWAATTWDDTTAVPGTNYDYTVSALNACGESYQSTPDQGWACVLPDPPTNVAASDGTYPDKVEVTWTAEPAADSYNIYRDSVLQQSGWTLTTWNDTTAVPGTHYQYTVSSVDTCGEGTQSPQNEGWRCVLPAAPTNVAASDGTFPFRVRVTWDAVAGATGYNIYRDSVLQESNWVGLTWDDTSITQGVSYDYTVSTVDTCGEGSQSAPDSGWACVTAPIPTGVDASDGLYPTKVTVTWNASAGATGYNIYRDTVIQETNWSGTTWDDTSVVPDTYYDYTVSALNACGESYQSTPDQGWACTVPDPPTNVQASDGSYPDKVEVTWTAAPDALSYRIYRDSVLQESGWTLTTWNDTTAVPGTHYQYTVSSFNTCGEGAQSTSDEGWRCVLPAAPTNVSASDGTFPYRVRVTWDAVAGATGYNIYRDSVLQESNWVGLTWDDTSITQGISYDYTVSAIDSCGEGAQSAPDSGWACVTAPIPTGVDASDGLYSNKVTVTWNASAGATGYNIYRDTVLQESNWAATTWDDTTAVPGTYYDYTVSALNACGESYQSTPDQGWACVLPDPPTNVSASDGSYPDKVEVTWTAEPAADSYNIYRDSVLQQSGWILTTWNDTTAVPGTHYQYTVSSVNTCGEGTQSSQNEGWRCVLPAAPTNVSASDGTFPYRVRVTWDAVAGATGYNIYRDSVLQESNWPGLTWDDMSVTQGVSYDYTVSAVDSCGEGSQSAPDSGWACVTAPIPTGVDASDGIYPNKVTVTWNASAGATGYNIYRDSIIQESNWSGTTWDDTSAVPGTSYDYTVSALNACGESYQSTPDTGWACVLPDVPTNVQASDGTYMTLVEITWDAAAGATQYDIFRDSVEIASDIVGTLYQDNTAAGGVVYTYQVRSENTCGTSNLSTGNTGFAQGCTADTNDTYDTADVINLDDTKSGCVDMVDIDWYEFYVTPNGIASGTIDLVVSGGTAEMRLYGMDPGDTAPGTLITTSNNIVINNNIYSRYFIRLIGTSGQVGYDLTTNITAALTSIDCEIMVADDGTGQWPIWETPDPDEELTLATLNQMWTLLNLFWNQYGYNHVWDGTPTIMASQFYILDDTPEATLMHQTYGLGTSKLCLYFVDQLNSGNTAYCRVYSTKANHNVNNVFSVYSPNVWYWSNVIAHEHGHGIGYYFDEYLYDVAACACGDNICLGYTPYLFWESVGCYNGNLMWYYIGGWTWDMFDITVGQEQYIHRFRFEYPGNFPFY